MGDTQPLDEFLSDEDEENTQPEDIPQVDTFKELYFYHSSHGIIPTKEPLVDSKRDPVVFPVESVFPDQTIVIRLKNRASLFHTIRVGRLTQYGDIDAYNPDQFEDYLEITIVGREIKQIKVANPTSDTNKVMIVYDKDNGIAIDTPTIEFEYSDNDKSLDFPMSSFQIIRDIDASGDTKYRLADKRYKGNVWESKCIIRPKYGLTQSEFLHGYESSYIDTIVRHIQTQIQASRLSPIPNLYITILNSSCLSVPQLRDVYKQFSTWCDFFNVHMILGSKKWERSLVETKFQLQHKLTNQIREINQVRSQLDETEDMDPTHRQILQKTLDNMNHRKQTLMDTIIDTNRQIDREREQRSFVDTSMKNKRVRMNEQNIYRDREEPVFNKRFKGGKKRKLTQKRRPMTDPLAEYLFKHLSVN